MPSDIRRATVVRTLSHLHMRFIGRRNVRPRLIQLSGHYYMIVKLIYILFVCSKNSFFKLDLATVINLTWQCVDHRIKLLHVDIILRSYNIKFNISEMRLWYSINYVLSLKRVISYVNSARKRCSSNVTLKKYELIKKQKTYCQNFNFYTWDISG